MRRTTILLDPELDHWVRGEARRRGTSISHVIREAVRSAAAAADDDAEWDEALAQFIGCGDSGDPTLAFRVDEALEESGFGCW